MGLQIGSILCYRVMLGVLRIDPCISVPELSAWQRAEGYTKCLNRILNVFLRDNCVAFLEDLQRRV